MNTYRNWYYRIRLYYRPSVIRQNLHLSPCTITQKCMHFIESFKWSIARSIIKVMKKIIKK